MQRRRSLGSLFLAITVFTTNCVLSHSYESNFWDQRRSSHQEIASNALAYNTSSTRSLPGPSAFLSTPLNSQLPKTPKLSFGLKTLIDSIPDQQATIHDFYDSGVKTSAGVLIIQDVHMNSEAQFNIADVLKRLLDRDQIGLVAVEGAFQSFDFSDFQSALDKTKLHYVAESFLKNNQLGAPSFVGVNSANTLIPFVGVDDKKRYEKNVEAYLASRDKRESILSKLGSLERGLEREADRTLSGPLRRFDSLQRAYHEGKTGLGAYAVSLAGFGLTPGETLKQFLEAYKIEKELNFKKIEIERSQLIQRLFGRLNRGESAEFMAESFAYRTGKIGFSEFFRKFEERCIAKHISLGNTPELERFIRYVLLSDGIKFEKLTHELNLIEANVLARLVSSVKEKQILSDLQFARLAEKLVDFSLTFEDWTKYQALKKTASIKLGLHSFERFYLEADIRSHLMAQNVLAVNQLKLPKPIVLIAGGFHTPLIAKHFRNKNVSHVVISPKISKVGTVRGNAYLSVFAREKTPLDRLFSGKTLFLKPAAQEITDPATAARLKASVLARMAPWDNRNIADVKLTHGHAPVRLRVNKAKDPAEDTYRLQFELSTVIREFLYRAPLALIVLVNSELLRSPFAFSILWLFNGVLAVQFARKHNLSSSQQLIVGVLGILLGGVFLNYEAVSRYGFGTILISIGLHFLYNHFVRFLRVAAKNEIFKMGFPSLKKWELLLPFATIKKIGLKIGYPLTPLHALHRGRIWINPLENRPEPELLEKHFGEAHAALKGSVHRTPLVPLKRIGAITGKQVFLKDESAQVGGSFKARGVYYEIFMAIERVISDPNQQAVFEKGLRIVTQSTGNHGIALMRSTTKIIEVLLQKYKDRPDIVRNLKKIQPIVFTLKNLPSVKRRDMEKALKDYQLKFGSEKGAIKDEYVDYEDALKARTAFIKDQGGAALYMEHSGRDIMLGHGTAGIEIAEQLTEAGISPDKKVVLIIPVGAGGPIGIAAAMKAFRENSKAVMVQSKRWDALVRSLKTGKLQKNPRNIPPTFTIVQGNTMVALTFPDGIAVDGPEGASVEDAKRYLDAGIAASEKKAFQQAAVLLWRDLKDHYQNREKVKVGGTTALTAEALLSFFNDVTDLQDADAVVLFGTEGNVDPLVLEILEKRQPQVQLIEDMYRNELKAEVTNGTIRYRSSIFPYAPTTDKEREMFEHIRVLVSSWWPQERLEAIEALSKLASDLESGLVADPTGHLQAALHWAEEPLQDLNPGYDLVVVHAIDGALGAIHKLDEDMPLLPKEFRPSERKEYFPMLSKVEETQESVYIAADPLFDILNFQMKEKTARFAFPHHNNDDTKYYNLKEILGVMWNYLLLGLGRWLPDSLRLIRVAMTGDVIVLRASKVFSSGEEELEETLWKDYMRLAFYRWPESVKNIIRHKLSKSQHSRIVVERERVQQAIPGFFKNEAELADTILVEILTSIEAYEILGSVIELPAVVESLLKLKEDSRPTEDELTGLREQSLRFRTVSEGPSYPALILDWLHGRQLPSEEESVLKEFKEVLQKVKGEGLDQSYPINLMNLVSATMLFSVTAGAVMALGHPYSLIPEINALFFIFAIYLGSFLFFVFNYRMLSSFMNPIEGTGPPLQVFGYPAIPANVDFIQYDSINKKFEINRLIYASLVHRNPILRFFTYFFLHFFAVGLHEKIHVYGFRSEFAAYFFQFIPAAVVGIVCLVYSDWLIIPVILLLAGFAAYSTITDLPTGLWVKIAPDGKKRKVTSVANLRALMDLAHNENRTIGLTEPFQKLKSGQPIYVQIYDRVLNPKKYSSLANAIYALGDRLEKSGILDEFNQWREFLKIREAGGTVVYAVYLPGQSEPLVIDGHVPEEILAQAEYVVYLNSMRATAPGRTAVSAAPARLDDPSRQKLNPSKFSSEKPEAQWIRWQGVHHAWRIFLNQYPIFPQKTGRPSELQPFNILIVRDDEPASQFEMGDPENIDDLLALMQELHGIENLSKTVIQELSNIIDLIVKNVRGRNYGFNMLMYPSNWIDRTKFRIGINGWLAGASQAHAHAHASRVPFPIERAQPRMEFITAGIQLRVNSNEDWGGSIHIHRSGLNVVLHPRKDTYPRSDISDGYDLVSRMVPIIDGALFFDFSEEQNEAYQKLISAEDRFSWIRHERANGRLQKINPKIPALAREWVKQATLSSQDVLEIVREVKGKVLSPGQRSSPGKELETVLEAWSNGKTADLVLTADDGTRFKFSHQSKGILHSITIHRDDQEVGYLHFRLFEVNPGGLQAVMDAAHPKASLSVVDMVLRSAIFVEPAVSYEFDGRYRGLGRTLMALGERLAFKMGARQFIADDVVEKARDFYEALGFDEAGQGSTESFFYRMEKSLTPDNFSNIGIRKVGGAINFHNALSAFTAVLAFNAGLFFAFDSLFPSIAPVIILPGFYLGLLFITYFFKNFGRPLVFKNEKNQSIRLFGRRAVRADVEFIEFNRSAQEFEINSLLFHFLSHRYFLIRFFTQLTLNLFFVPFHEQVHAKGIKSELAAYFVQTIPVLMASIFYGHGYGWFLYGLLMLIAGISLKSAMNTYQKNSVVIDDNKDSMRKGAKWLASIGRALIYKDINALIQIKPLGIGEWGGVVHDEESAILNRLEIWAQNSDFRESLVSELNENNFAASLSNEQKAVLIDLLIASVISKEETHRSNNRLVLFKGVSATENDRQVRRMGIMRLLVAGDVQAVTRFVVDESARPEVEAAINDVRLFGVMSGFVDIVTDNKIFIPPTVSLDYLRERFNKPHLIILPGSMKPADAPIFVIAFEDWMGPIIKMNLTNILQVLRIVLTAA